VVSPTFTGGSLNGGGGGGADDTLQTRSQGIPSSAASSHTGFSGVDTVVSASAPRVSFSHLLQQ
jgi:hypothetical protein